MNDVREIVTRAVLAKGRKVFKVKETVNVSNDVTSVLGCWIINHSFEANLKDKEVEVIGNFENDIWYSYDNNSATSVGKTTTEYKGVVRVREINCDNISDHCDVVARVLQQPTCTNAVITPDGIVIDVVFELLVEVIGETKMMVNVVSCPNNNEPIDDFEGEINEDFLNEER